MKTDRWDGASPYCNIWIWNSIYIFHFLQSLVLAYWAEKGWMAACSTPTANQLSTSPGGLGVFFLSLVILTVETLFVKTSQCSKDINRDKYIICI